MQNKLENAVFITGAGQRVGLYLAMHFLEQARYPVVFSYRTESVNVAKLKSLGAVGIQVDFTQEASFNAFEVAFIEQVKSLRGVIHNASLWHKDQAVLEHSTRFNDMLAVHTLAPFRLNYLCQPLLKAAKGGVKDIISITDMSIKVGRPDQIAYLATKSALHSMSQSFAQAFAPEIKVNEIAPGLVVFNEGDSDDYKKQRLSAMSIALEPGEDVIWQTVQYLMALPNTTGTCVSLANK